MTESIIGYWFAASDTLQHGDGRKVVIGERLTVEGPLELCKNGLHASREPFDALFYASSNMLYKVKSEGEIKEDGDKYCSRHRTALAAIDATELLRTFARQQALSVIHLWDAPAVVREYLETGNENIRAAAYDTARAAYAAADTTTDTARATDTAYVYAADAYDTAYAAYVYAADAAYDATDTARAAYAAADTAYAAYAAYAVRTAYAAAYARAARAAYAARAATARKQFDEMVYTAFAYPK